MSQFGLHGKFRYTTYLNAKQKIRKESIRINMFTLKFKDLREILFS
jgi:hypothetical protein